MSAPRLEVDLDKVGHNARTLVTRLGRRGLAVTGVTKATLGSPDVARVLLDAGVERLGDSRIENLEALRRSGVDAPLTLIRSPMLSQVDRVVATADTSCNTEVSVLEALSDAAGRLGRSHGVVLMVEMGDLREGILPSGVDAVVELADALPHLRLEGLGTNLGCQSGMAPDAGKMAELSSLVESVERRTGIALPLVSGGNSANLDWAFGEASVGRVNDLRLGESILLGREALHRRPVAGLHLDAFTLVAEVIELQTKPSLPWGRMTRTAFGGTRRAEDRGELRQAIVAIGHQDVAPDGLLPPPGMAILGASSDHLVVDVGGATVAVGDELRLQPDYAALLRAMTSPFVAEVMTRSATIRAPSRSRSPAAT
jgi:ornithine racemase